MDEKKPLSLSIFTPRMKHKAITAGTSSYSCSFPSVLKSNDSLGVDFLPRRWDFNAVVGEDGTEYDRDDGEDVNDEEDDDNKEEEKEEHDGGEDGTWHSFLELHLGKMVSKRVGFELFLTAGRFVAAEK